MSLFRHPATLLLLLLAADFSSCSSQYGSIGDDDEHVTPLAGASLSLDQRDRQEQALGASNLVAGGYLLAERTDQKLNLSDPVDRHLSEVLDRQDSYIKSARYNYEFYDITTNVSIRAWQLLHEHAEKAIRQRVELAWPALRQVLLESQVSEQCFRASQEVMLGAKRMDDWALKLINSWGNFPPIGIFEGSYTELGSYHVCTGLGENKHIGHAHYCSISLRPVLPSKRDYELVFTKLPRELLEVFNRSQGGRDAFADLLEHAHYHHYVYYRWHTCWPIQCGPFDVKRVGKYLARTNMLMMGPVKCYSAYGDDYTEPDPKDNKTTLTVSTRDVNNGIYILFKPKVSFGQKLTMSILVALLGAIILMTLIDLFIIRSPRIYCAICQYLDSGSSRVDHKPNDDKPKTTKQDDSSEFKAKVVLYGRTIEEMKQVESSPERSIIDPTNITEKKQLVVTEPPRRPSELSSPFLSLVDDCSIISNTARFLEIPQVQLKNDILCLHGIRCITMSWIIMTHTMMYNDFGQFARTREIEKSLDSLVTAPIFNGTYQVDTFFLLSGLLTGFTVFKQTKGLIGRFSVVNFMVGRWLRLTPQMILSVATFILLPMITAGPHWYYSTAESSEFCQENWWINLIHVQIFYKTRTMCSFASWWVSLDFFYHSLSVVVILLILFAGPKTGFLSLLGLLISFVSYQGLKHYEMGFPTNMFSTIPQIGKMWSEFTLNFYWQPYSHSVPFFLGFYIGYLMVMKREAIKAWFTPKKIILGWTLTTVGLVFESYSTFWWLTGRLVPTRLEQTLLHITLPIIWSLCYAWIIMACHHGHGGWINRFLSLDFFIRLSRASYMIYLTHFFIVFLVFGQYNLLLEPTPITMVGLMLVMINLSAVYGIIMAIVFESPWLRIVKKIMRHI